MDDLTNQKR